MKKFLTPTLFSLIIILAIFTFLEVFSRFFFKPGADSFIERVQMEQGLRPKKTEGEYRIFLFGESTMHGDYLAPKSTIKKWLSFYFEALLPKEAFKKITIINFGRLGEDSRFISQAFLDTLAHQPDLAVFYSAHNDFTQLENRQLFLKPLPIEKKLKKHFRRLIKKSAFLSEVNRLGVRIKHHRKIKEKQKEESQPIDPPFQERPSKRYVPETDLLPPTSEEHRKIAENWKKNIQKIIRAAQDNEVPVIFYKGIANLKDYPPYESVHSNDMDEAMLSEWEVYFENAVNQLENQQFEIALRLLLRCFELDPNYALTHYRLAQCYESLSKYDKAKAYYLSSNDLDHFPIRGPSLINKYYDFLNRQNLAGVFIIETPEIFEKYFPRGIIDHTLIPDGVHPTIKGQALMAYEVVKLIHEEDLFGGKEIWDWREVPSIDQLSEKIDADNFFWYGVYIKLGRYFGRNFDRKIEFTKRALKLRPHSPNAKRQLAWAYWEKGDREKAIKLYQELYEVFPEMMKKVFRSHPEIGEAVVH